ncbi:MAG: DUF2336 domain-containing protein [Alphaproteobacteria bacterium]|nr:DUF2336 domain-containing protein [Alphaproteobacteria bacterium]
MKDEPSLGLDIGIFQTVIDGGNADQRLALATQLAEFLAKEDVAKAEHELIVPVVLKLAVDPVADVRRALANGLKAVANLNSDILFSIISDDDAIALPFLAATPALNHWHMMAVLRVGDGARQASVMLRPDISAEAVAFAVKSLPLPLCLLLFENAAVRLDDQQYHMLYSRFGHSGDMTERLLARPDLPLDIRIMQAKRASNRMHQLMAERGWLPANDAAELVADAEENAVLRILVEASDEELARLVGFLAAKAMLTPSIIVRAACLGEMHVVEQVLAHLAGVPLARARDQMHGKGLTGFKGLHAKSGLPSSCYWILQAACDVSVDEAEEGVTLDAEEFGRRIIEALMTRYETLQLKDRTRHLEFIGRFAADRARIIAKRLKADLVRAA